MWRRWCGGSRQTCTTVWVTSKNPRCWRKASKPSTRNTYRRTLWVGPTVSLSLLPQGGFVGNVKYCQWEKSYIMMHSLKFLSVLLSKQYWCWSCRMFLCPQPWMLSLLHSLWHSIAIQKWHSKWVFFVLFFWFFLLHYEPNLHSLFFLLAVVAIAVFAQWLHADMYDVQFGDSGNPVCQVSWGFTVYMDAVSVMIIMMTMIISLYLDCPESALKKKKMWKKEKAYKTVS